jgi:hypothetical protein
MPDFKRVSPRDAERYFLKRGHMDLTEYENFLRDLKSGDVSEARMSEDETERAIKRRLTVAAKSLGKQIQYSNRADEGAIVFRLK